MEDLKIALENMVAKCKLLDNFADLYLRKNVIAGDLTKLKSKADEVQAIVSETKKFYEKRLPLAIKQYEQLIKESQAQQITILNLILEIKKRKEAGLHGKFLMKENLHTPLKQINMFGTPRMLLSDYQNSPLVSLKKRPTALQFTDFEANVTEEMFKEIPKYMRGRETQLELQDFLSNVLIPCFNDKYELIYRKRETIRSNADLEIWRMYQFQLTLFPRTKFITQDDLSRKVGRMIDRKLQSKLTMLRHLGIIQEQRKSSTVAYIWSVN